MSIEVAAGTSSSSETPGTGVNSRDFVPIMSNIPPPVDRKPEEYELTTVALARQGQTSCFSTGSDVFDTLKAGEPDRFTTRPPARTSTNLCRNYFLARPCCGGCWGAWQLGKKVLATIFEAWPLVMSWFQRKYGLFATSHGSPTPHMHSLTLHPCL